MKKCCGNCMSGSFLDIDNVICIDSESSNYLGVISKDDCCSFFDTATWWLIDEEEKEDKSNVEKF